MAPLGVTPLVDRLGRPLRNLRLSVTDRCNLRCQYCMPEEEYVWLPREDLLHFEEMSRFVDAFTGCGVDKVRLTGGEPLLRRDLPTLVSLLSAKPALRDLAMTTNGVLLTEQAGALKQAGLHRVTVSLDTLQPDRFKTLTRQNALDSVLAGLRAAREAFGTLKLDTVVIRGVNDDEIVSLLDFARAEGAELRYIEYMDVGGATRWSMDKVVSRPEILDQIARARGPVEALAEETSAPADRFRLSDGTTFGIISSTTDPFCRSCDRSRVTADGMWYLCLYGSAGIDLRRPLRDGRSLTEIAALIESVWQGRTDRGAETRLTLHDRRPFVPVSALRANPHLEMHTRGG
jgi:cyclic pyranopterin phosphate synthase